MVTGAVPEDVKVTYRGAAELSTITLPKATLAALSFSAGVSAFNFTARALVTVPALAVIVAVCAVSTQFVVAVNLALETLAGTITAVGTLKEASLLERATANPPVAAAAFKETVHTSVVDPETAELAQESPVNSGVPVPLMLITAFGAADEVLVMVNRPAAAPARSG